MLELPRLPHAVTRPETLLGPARAEVAAQTPVSGGVQQHRDTGGWQAWACRGGRAAGRKRGGRERALTSAGRQRESSDFHVPTPIPGVNPRELLVYKNCTDNCTFVYEAHQPPPAPKTRSRANSFYWVLCCSVMTCNDGGPANVERDILPEEPIEEVIEGAVCLRGSELLLGLASILLSGALTWVVGLPSCSPPLQSSSLPFDVS